MNGMNLTRLMKIFGKMMDITLKMKDENQIILSQKQIVTIMNFLRFLKTFHCILLDYPIQMRGLLDTSILDKNWRGYTPKTFVSDKLSPDNLILVEMVNVPLHVIQKTITSILIVLD